MPFLFKNRQRQFLPKTSAPGEVTDGTLLLLAGSRNVTKVHAGQAIDHVFSCTNWLCVCEYVSGLRRGRTAC